MRQVARVDSNQIEIVAALRKMGASVQHLHWLGRGCPDLMAGFNGHNLLFELKNGNLSPSRRRLTADEEEWHQHWRGQVAVVGSVSEALELVDAYPHPPQKELLT